MTDALKQSVMPNAVSREWVKCPICGEPDMRKEQDAEGCALILCVNHGCRSNGGKNDLDNAALRAGNDAANFALKSASIAMEDAKRLQHALRAQLAEKEREISKLQDNVGTALMTRTADRIAF